MTDVRCRGNESSLDQCPHSEWGVPKGGCDSHTYDACLVCDNPQYYESGKIYSFRIIFFSIPPYRYWVVSDKCQTLREGGLALLFARKSHFDFVYYRPRPQSVLNASDRCPGSKMFRCHLVKQALQKVKLRTAEMYFLVCNIIYQSFLRAGNERFSKRNYSL